MKLYELKALLDTLDPSIWEMDVRFDEMWFSNSDDYATTPHRSIKVGCFRYPDKQQIQFFEDNRLHRETGPASISFREGQQYSKYYYIKGKKLSQSQYDIYRKSSQATAALNERSGIDLAL